MMKQSLFIFLLAALLSVLSVTATPQYYPKDLNKDPVVIQFQSIVKLVHTLYLEQSAAFSSGKTSLNPQTLEETLFTLAKTLDAATSAVQTEGSLDQHTANTVYGYTQKFQKDIVKVTANIILEKYYLKQLKLDQTTVVILQTLVPGFDKLYRALETSVPSEYRKVLASLFISIICDMDKAADALKPGVKITDGAYCKTYSPTGKPDLQNCPDKPWPTLPSSPQSFDDCNQSCGSVLKFAYQNECWSKGDSIPWCTPTPKQPVWSPCTQDWTPKQWVCNKQ